MKLRFLVTVSALLAADFVCAEEPWRFITLADWHWAESYVWQEKFPDRYQQTLEKHTAEVATIKKLFGGDLMMLPGDSNTGHWDETKFIQNFMPGATPEQSVLKAGNLCYSGMIKAFHDGGYSRLLMAVGDHEMGDNPWPSGSVVSRCQPQFKEAFAKAWNTDPDGGDFIYSAPIGKAPSRPLGTLYEGTSFAYRYKNVLFITVDVFHQESPSKVIGEEGTVTGAVTGEHLAWLDQILSEVRKDPSVCHIFVQGHLPVIYPVRKVSSSGMLMDHGTESDFWNVLRKYQVDIYFAGEVHDNTVTKDPDSNLLQVVSRGNFFDNIMTVDVTDRQIELTSYNQTGTAVTDGQYKPYGHLLVDKSGAQTKIDGTGVLALLQ
ncbi:MAG: metallophosphoesterase, partial [Kiritimatiellales bacterium]